jgi:hypothetical protein
MREWFSRSKFLLSLASAVIRDHTRRARSPFLYSPGTGWPNYTLRHWVTFSSPLTARRATVEVFDPAFKRDCLKRSSLSFL